MGTLTAGQPRLDHYCEHKLPTSCRLSSLGECCACKDERAHAATYPTYIDGIGFVPRGNRWQRYCWFCKEFWENRVSASGLRPAQTCIPEVPDQSDFLARWYDFHRGYRIVTKEDGSEERVAVLGEDFREVSPGVLPRTLEELRAGRERSEVAEQERLEAIRQRHAREALEPAVPEGPSIEDALDQLLQSTVEDADQSRVNTPATAVRRPNDDRHSNIHTQSMVGNGTRSREYQARRVAALRRELHRMRSGIERVISGLRDLGEDVPDHTNASSRLMDLGRTLDNIAPSSSDEAGSRPIESTNATTESTGATRSDRALLNLQSRVDEARRHVEEARRNRDQAATELDLAEREFQISQSRMRQLQREQRTAENYTRIFGTREEMAAQGEQYQSPIGGMFERAYERFRTAEDVRREERTLRQVLEDETRSGGEDVSRRIAELEARGRDVWGVPQRSSSPWERDLLRQTTITQDTNSDAERLISHVPVVREDGSDLEPRGEEVALEQYYTLLRRQGWNSEQTTDAPEQADRGRMDLPGEIPRASDSITATSFGAGPPGQQLDAEPHVDNDRGLDALFVLTALSGSESLRSNLPENPTTSFIARLEQGVRENNLTQSGREHIEAILDDINVIWGSGLPAERLRRRRQRGEQVGFSEMAHEIASVGSIVVHDVEIMAEVFQMSGNMRRYSGLNSREQLRVLYRLQRGERTPEDRAVLSRMLQNESTFSQAKHVQEQQNGQSSTNREVAELVVELTRTRQRMVREGDHSRMELDSRRRATQALAVAAGRLAMQTAPSTLMERLASRDEATRAAYERVQANGFTPATMSNRQFRNAHAFLNMEDFTAALSDTDSEPEPDEDGKGLDARDTGRPTEPLPDEEMTVKLDCQICYAQLADVACLPCGHLVMCRWCSDQHSPTMQHDKTRPRRAATCPVCRKKIRQKVRVFRS